MEIGITNKLVEFVGNHAFENIPLHVISLAKQHILNTLGCMLLGSNNDAINKTRSLCEELGGACEATIAGASFAANAVFASLINGFQGDAFELGDRHTESGLHPGPMIVPAALAMAERIHANGMTFLNAVVVGYEAGCRIGSAIMPSRYERGWYFGTAGTFGAVAAAAKVLNLRGNQLGHALGLAGAQAFSPTFSYRSDAKYFNVGKAAMAGVLSALLAQKGVTGGLSILEGNPEADPLAHSFFEMVGGAPKVERIYEGLGVSYELERCSLKPYSCCGDMHSSIDAAFSIKHKYDVRPEEIKAIRVGSFRTVPTRFNIPAPQTSLEAMLSFQHGIATALFADQVLPEQFTMEWVNNPVIDRIRKVISLEVDAELDKYWPTQRAATVEVATPRGNFAETVIAPKGTFENPLTESEVQKQFLSMAGGVIPRPSAEKLGERVYNLEKIEDIHEITILLKKSSAGKGM
ncbi:MAG: MmgE/PrpD family protein [Deltaproteobacteria bacterium]|nr:MmgE/PrpD family protein [Deltaproteobacteria bacterium]